MIKELIGRALRRETITTDQEKAQAIIDISGNFPRSISSVLKLAETNPNDTFNPFFLDPTGRTLLDISIRENAAERKMTKNETPEPVKEIVRKKFDNQITNYTKGLGISDPFEQATYLSPIRRMADILMSTYFELGAISTDGDIDKARAEKAAKKKQAIDLCKSLAREYRISYEQQSRTQELAHKK